MNALNSVYTMHLLKFSFVSHVLDYIIHMLYFIVFMTLLLFQNVENIVIVRNEV